MPDPKQPATQIYYTEFGVDAGRDGKDLYYDLKFNPNPEDYIEYLVTSKHKIFFSVLDTKNPERTKAYYPNEQTRGIDSHVQYTQSIFLKNTPNTKTDAAITGTTGGYIIVWDICEALCKDDQVVTDRRRIKEVDLLGRYKKDKDNTSSSERDHINILVNYEEYIVIGTGGGTVNFYNYNFIIVRWFENICWLVKSISFDMAPSEYRQSQRKLEEGNDNDKEKTEKSDKFSCVPFIISDISATIKRIHTDKNKGQEEFIKVSDDNLKFEEIYRGIESEITCIAIHPKKNLIAVGTRGICPNPKKESTNKPKKDKIIKEEISEINATDNDCLDAYEPQYSLSIFVFNLTSLDQ